VRGRESLVKFEALSDGELYVLEESSKAEGGLTTTESRMKTESLLKSESLLASLEEGERLLKVTESRSESLEGLDLVVEEADDCRESREWGELCCSHLDFRDRMSTALFLAEGESADVFVVEESLFF
jgi:hypothetical protein